MYRTDADDPKRDNQSKLAMRSFGFLVVLIHLIPVLFIFQNCSQPYNVDVVEYDESSEDLSNAFLINGGQAVTNQKTVILSFNKAYAKEVLITTDKTCTQGEWAPYVDNRSYTFSGDDGTYQLFAKFRNAKDEESPCLKAEIMVDTMAPDVAIDLESSVANPTSSNSARIFFTLTESTSGTDPEGVQCQLRKVAPTEVVLIPFEPCQSPYEVVNLDLNATFELEVKAVDRAGNLSAKRIFSWETVDTSETFISFTTRPNKLTNNPMADFSFTSSNSNNPLSGYQCRLNAASTYEDCSSASVYYSLSRSGEYTLYVKAWDRVGSEVTGSYTWVVDVDPPVVQKLAVDNKNPRHQSHTASQDVLASWNASDVGPAGLDLTRTVCRFRKKDPASDYAVVSQVQECGRWDSSRGLYLQALDIPNVKTPYGNETLSEPLLVEVLLEDKAGNTTAVPLSDLPSSPGVYDYVLHDSKPPSSFSIRGRGDDFWATASDHHTPSDQLEYLYSFDNVTFRSCNRDVYVIDGDTYHAHFLRPDTSKPAYIKFIDLAGNEQVHELYTF